MSAPEGPMRRDPTQGPIVPAQPRRDGPPAPYDYVVQPSTGQSGSSEEFVQKPPVAPGSVDVGVTGPVASASDLKPEAINVPLPRRDDRVPAGEPIPGAVDRVAVNLTQNPPRTQRWSVEDLRPVTQYRPPSAAEVAGANPTNEDTVPRESVVDKYTGENTTFSVIPQDRSGIEVVVGNDQSAEALAGIVLPAVQAGEIVDVVDFGRISDQLIEEAEREGLPIRVVDALSLVHLMPPKDANFIAMEVIKVGSEPERAYGSNLLDRIQDSLQRTADDQGDMNPTFKDIIDGVRYLRVRDQGGLEVPYQQALDKAKILSDGDRQIKANDLANLESQLIGLYNRSVLATQGNIHDRISTVWQAYPNPRNTRDMDISRTILLNALPALFADRALDGVVISGMQILNRDTTINVRDAARRVDIRLVAFFDPATIPPELIDLVGSDRSHSLVVMGMRSEAAQKFETKFPLTPVLDIGSVSRGGGKGKGISTESGVTKSDGKPSMSGGEGESENDNYTLAVAYQKILQSAVLAAELVALQRGQAIVLTPDGVIHRPTLRRGMEPSVKKDPNLLSPEDEAFLESVRQPISRTQGGGVSAARGGTSSSQPTERLGHAARYKGIADRVVRPDETKQTHAWHNLLLAATARNDKNRNWEGFLHTKEGYRWLMTDTGQSWLRIADEGQDWVGTRRGRRFLEWQEIARNPQSNPQEVIAGMPRSIGEKLRDGIVHMVQDSQRPSEPTSGEQGNGERISVTRAQFHQVLVEYWTHNVRPSDDRSFDEWVHDPATVDVRREIQRPYDVPSRRSLEEFDMRSKSDREAVYTAIQQFRQMGDGISEVQQAQLRRLETWMESARIGDHYPRNQGPLNP